MATWNVSIQLYFTRTNGERTKKEEPNPTKKQLDAYMRKGSKYKKYMEDMYLYGDYGYMPKKIKYCDGGKLSYELSGEVLNYYKKKVFPTKESVLQDIMESSFEDGMYASSPGSHGVYPTKNVNSNVNPRVSSLLARLPNTNRDN